MSADSGARCDKHVGEVFPPRCADCEHAQLDALAEVERSNPIATVAAEVVEEAFAASDLSLDDLAAAVGIERVLLEEQLGGGREFAVSDLWKIAVVLGADVVAWTREIQQRAAIDA